MSDLLELDRSGACVLPVMMYQTSISGPWFGRETDREEKTGSNRVQGRIGEHNGRAAQRASERRSHPIAAKPAEHKGAITGARVNMRTWSGCGHNRDRPKF